MRTFSNVLTAPLAAVMLSGCGALSTSADYAAGGKVWEGAVPRAACGPGANPETDLQGRVSIEDRQSGRSQLGYWCNLERVAQLQGEGAGWQLAVFRDCAYYGTTNSELQSHRGVVVADVSNPLQPVPTAYLDTDAMLNPWEGLKVSEQRGVLAAAEYSGPGFSIYDIQKDCSQPELLAAVDLSNNGHAGGIAPDGLTYYGGTVLQAYYAVDIVDPTNPVVIAQWPAVAHDIATSEDGNRAYAASMGAGGTNGLTIWDISSIQSRAPNPRAVPVGAVTWEDGNFAQEADRVEIGGKPYVIFTDEGFQQHPCGSGLPLDSFARIIDISNERVPVVVSKLTLEVHDPANCATVEGDWSGVSSGFLYDSHYCTVDDPKDATVVACGYFNSGIRVFDIRDPANPKEIAYYNPPAQLGKEEQLPASEHNKRGVPLDADWAAANSHFVKERGELWITSQDNGFQVLRFTNGVWPFE